MCLLKQPCLCFFIMSFCVVTAVHAAWEADVAPRPDGDSDLLVNDWVQLGRFVAGLDISNPGTEFQRADCAPYADAGDGDLLVNDWVQAGRYVAGLDVLQEEYGPIHEGGPAMIPVPAGWFEMGRPYMDIGSGTEVPVHDVYLDAYQISKYEVTNQEYADVLNWAHSQGYLANSGGGDYTYGVIYAFGQPVADTQSSHEWSQINYSDGVFSVRYRTGHDNQSLYMADHPMVMVSWYGAACYCNWLSEQQGLQPCYNLSTWTRYEPLRNGYRLPTEAEWERTAAWDGREHWRYGMRSESIDITQANYYIGSLDYANPLGMMSYPYTAPVGWYNGVNPAQLNAPGTLTVNAKSHMGAYDMCGNALEWCHDRWYREYTPEPVTNPIGPTSGSYRVVRGGSWINNSYYCRAAYRDDIYTPEIRNSYIGFRISRTP